MRREGCKQVRTGCTRGLAGSKRERARGKRAFSQACKRAFWRACKRACGACKRACGAYRKVFLRVKGFLQNG